MCGPQVRFYERGSERSESLLDHRLHRKPRRCRHDPRAHSCARGSDNHQSESTSDQHGAPRRAIPGQAPVENDRLAPGCDRYTSNHRFARPFRLWRPPPHLQRAQQTPLKTSPEHPNNQPYFATIPFRVVIRPTGRRLAVLAGVRLPYATYTGMAGVPSLWVYPKRGIEKSIWLQPAVWTMRTQRTAVWMGRLNFHMS